ncbi:MAG: 4Fe-4S binding protein [Proteobacteria bacterium]|nr:4Fe-4S binding protein [Pseudomonadota bacterium]
MRRLTSEVPIAALGFFALVSQTLLFRDFLSSLEGNEIAVGTFFGSWLLWVGIGAVAGRLFSLGFPAALPHFLFFPLLYLPASFIQHQLIYRARSILGLESFVLVPLPSLLVFASLANAPTSFLTGFLFSMACTWVAGTFALPVARVYILETFGGFVGGLFVTGLLVLGMPGEKVFLYAALVLCTALLARYIPDRMSLLRWCLVASIAMMALFTIRIIGDLASNHAARSQWSRLLPVDTYKGSFITAQSQYLYGERDGDFIVMTEGGVIEALPEKEHASEVAAWAIAQNPVAANVLIVGPGGPAIASRLKVLPQIHDVVWLYPDPEFPKKIFDVLPNKIRNSVGHVNAPQIEVRAYLQQTEKKFDLVIVNLPEATTLVLNRYFSKAFFALVKNVLAPAGICAVRVSGGANYLSGERVLAGASTLTTLSSVFPRVALKPGDESFFFAATEDILSESPSVLAKGFAAVEGSSQLYPKEGLLAAFQQDRIAFQKDRYRSAEEKYGKNLLENTDNHPKALLFDMLLTLRRAGLGPVARAAVFLVDNGTWICHVGIFLYGLLRFSYLRNSLLSASAQKKERSLNLFEIQAMLFTAGLVGMSATVVLMFCYQVRFGSLFLDIGLISSLFMLGSALGGFACERLLLQRRIAIPQIILTITACETILFLIFIFQSPVEASRLALGVFFTTVGVFSGLYFPVAARCLNTSGYGVEAAAGRLELLDHVGGAVGALATGLILLPLLGTRASFLVLITTVIVINLMSLIARQEAASTVIRDWFDRNRRPFGYLFVGVGAFSMLVSQGFHLTQSDHEIENFQAAAAEMAGTLKRQEQKATLTDGTTFIYYLVPGGYLFPSTPLARGVRGYGGEIPLAIWIDDLGVLKNFRILPSNETPAYLAFLRGWLETLKEKELFTANGLQGIDAVSGATMSSAAILKTITRSSSGFGEVVLGRPAQGDVTTSFSAGPPWQFAAFVVWSFVVLAARYRPGRWTRRLILTVSLVLFGIVLNHQYASQQVMALLSGNFSLEIVSSAFFLIAVVPGMVVLFGNVYCGYLCPFGAIQELIGDLRPTQILPDPQRQVWRYGRFCKYIVLLLFILLFALTRDLTVLDADPLITIFGAAGNRMVIILALCLLVLSYFFRRFWCRNLCPAGAFLALLGGIRLLRRFLPKTRPDLCDMGVHRQTDLDCLQCDRCRHEKN